MYSSLTNQIIAYWKNFNQKVEISGINPSSSAYLCYDLLKQHKQRKAIICSNAESAAKLYQDIRTFFSLDSNSSILQKLDLYPGWEHSPYSRFSPSIKNKVRRLKTLSRLVLKNDIQVIVTDILSLTQTCPSFNNLTSRIVKLGLGDFISREDIIQKFETAGYTSTGLVEDPGSYSIRGNIIDVFSPWTKQPYRLEFFGDELENIRTFSPTTQTSFTEELLEAFIIPVTDWAFNQQTIANAKSNIKLFCDDYGIPKQTRDHFFEQLDLGIRDPSFDYLYPYFTGESGIWLPDYLNQLDQSWGIILYNSIDIDTSYDSLLTQSKEEFNQSIQSGKLIARWDDLFIQPDTLKSLIDTKVVLTLDPFKLGIPQVSQPEENDNSNPPDSEDKLQNNSHVSLQIYTNQDLKSEVSTPAAKDAHAATLNIFESKIKLWTKQQYRRIIFTTTQSQSDRVCYLLSQRELPCKIVQQVDWNDTHNTQIIEGSLSSGFRMPYEKIAFVTDSELFGQKKARSKQTNKSAEAHPSVGMGTFISTLSDLSPEDYIVHYHHGIGKYHGLVKLSVDRIPQDFLLIEYAQADKLYLPIYRLDLIQRYLGAKDSVSLDRLGSQNFEKTKEKVKSELEEVAHHLLDLYAKRASRIGFAYSPPNELYREFEAKFPYPETPDQLKSIDDISNDLESEKIMDRLICGDVGYGKTEVAMRAAFRAVMDNKQVAVLVPTTVLALQHERSFLERFKDSSINIAAISRFKSTKEVKETLQKIKEGKVDILIGTHRLLSKDVQFKDLGLLIIDEEQRFGVEHKEKLKALKVNTDVLTLSATPIPRTLQLSLIGLRDISIINTPPVDRLSIRTYIAKFDEEIIAKAIRQEMSRGGQVFFIHNRVQSIHTIADRLKSIVPEARIVVGHGQLDEKELESRMLSFYNKEFDVLLCSTIIESGLDIPSANTIIINRADAFGLSQLYQLRGRVGRSQVRAYCYLLLPAEGMISKEAKERLEVMQKFADLGAGFKIASHDLEIRGGGDIIGKSQSGHIAAIGYELYMELLEETIKRIKNEKVEDHYDPEIKLPVPALLPETYIPDIQQRLGLYQRISAAHTTEALAQIEFELQDRFGKLPEETLNLIYLIQIKQLLRNYHIKSLVVGKEKSSFEPGEKTKLSAEKTLVYIQKNPKRCSITPDSKVILNFSFDSIQGLHKAIENFLSQVAEQ